MSLIKRIEDIELKIAEIQTQLSDLEKNSLLRSPDWDSGWVEVDQNTEHVFHHMLRTTEYLVYFLGEFVGERVHQWWFGSELVSSSEKGAKWSSTDENTIVVHRGKMDDHWEKIRLRIWKLN
jgi:hypothetical protein